MAQIVTRIEEELVAAIDELVAAGVVASRSAAVRRGLHDLVDRHRRAEVGLRIVDGYRRIPQIDAEVGWSGDATAKMIADEPW